jgi:hypothetical protein
LLPLRVLLSNDQTTLYTIRYRVTKIYIYIFIKEQKWWWRMKRRDKRSSVVCWGVLCLHMKRHIRPLTYFNLCMHEKWITSKKKSFHLIVYNIFLLLLHPISYSTLECRLNVTKDKRQITVAMPYTKHEKENNEGNSLTKHLLLIEVWVS